MVGEECLAAWKECREEEAFEACLFFYADCSPLTQSPSPTRNQE